MKTLIFTLIFSLCMTISGFASDPFERRFSAELVNTNLTTAIQAMASKVGADFAVSEDVKKLVTVSIRNKTFREAMEILGSIANFNWTYKNNTIYISPKDTMLQSRSFILRYADPAEIKKQLEVMLPSDKIAINLDTGGITVSGSTAEMIRIQELIYEMDQPIKQVHIAVKMVELSDSDSKDLGFTHTWNTYNSKTGTAPLEINTIFQAAQTLNKGRIIASPSITTMNGREANILMGTREPILETSTDGSSINNTSIRYEEVGYKVVCTPQIKDTPVGEFVTLKLKPSVSTIVGWVKNSDSTAPQIATRETETYVTVRSGETIVIGGLVKNEDVKTLSQIPGLSKIPFFGELFKFRSTKKDRSTIYICVTPTVVSQFDNPFVLPSKYDKEFDNLGVVAKENKVKIAERDKKEFLANALQEN